MSDIQKKMVKFKGRCQECKNWKTPEVEEPCNTCMTANYNDNSDYPVNYDGPRPGDK